MYCWVTWSVLEICKTRALTGILLLCYNIRVFPGSTCSHNQHTQTFTQVHILFLGIPADLLWCMEVLNILLTIPMRCLLVVLRLRHDVPLVVSQMTSAMGTWLRHQSILQLFAIHLLQDYQIGIVTLTCVKPFLAYSSVVVEQQVTAIKQSEYPRTCLTLD